MDTENSLNYIPTAEDIAESMETCCLCGARLNFRHHTDFYTLQVEEEASCPDCGVKNKVTTHILQ